MTLRIYKYCSPFIVFVLAWISFSTTGIYSFLPIIWAFIFIPTVELFMKPDAANMNAAEEELARNDKRYDYLLYAVVILQYISLFYFLYSVIPSEARNLHSSTSNLSPLTLIGRITSMGLLCGIFGINVGHELGHRANKQEQFLAKLLLLSTQYMHFFIEHNKGHHKRVATLEDPASARLGENIFFFYPRTIIFSYISAWEIANKEAIKKTGTVWRIKNEMLQFTVLQLLFVVSIGLLFGLPVLCYYMCAAAIGIALLEAVNYIEHYGLSRKEIQPGKYERPQPIHSWNSNHVLGRLMLFELSRHSDHHYLASRKYQVLQHHDDAPQMPTGYPGMIILAHLPPLFFWVMKREVSNLSK
ncbi:MAG: alkane 1-monooxygenase [Chitinophagaceae bacterium]|nr:alkane 1-monooxygenase [Chitinophagaceae bacterium]